MPMPDDKNASHLRYALAALRRTDRELDATIANIRETDSPNSLGARAAAIHEAILTLCERIAEALDEAR